MVLGTNNNGNDVLRKYDVVTFMAANIVFDNEMKWCIKQMMSTFIHPKKGALPGRRPALLWLGEEPSSAAKQLASLCSRVILSYKIA